ncbi:hypothetical protein JCM21900_003220 [Sporobolomyces salmonicolor]
MPAKLPTAPPIAISSTNPFSALDAAEIDEHLALSLRLIDAVLDHDDQLVRKLVLEEKVDCWVQDQQGWTSLHAAAYTGNTEHLNLLLRKGNAVWNIVDTIGCSAGDIAYSMNNTAAYELLLAEGVRAEMLRAVLEAVNEGAASDDGEEASAVEAEHDEDAAMVDRSTPSEPPSKPSTASDNAHFLSRPLTFTRDSSGQEIALDEEGNGVMMGWEAPIMEATARAMCEDGWGDRKGKARDELVREEEEGEREPLRVMNIGFGLGIIDTHLQSYVPTLHLIIEPHPSVLEHARAKGWFEKPGVRFYKGTWQQYMKDLEEGREEYVAWDGVYFDTYSEHYSDLHRFFQSTPDLLSPSPSATFSFFHGLGATSRAFYDVYTTVSELHLREVGLRTRWVEVEVLGEGREWEGTERKYWSEERAVGAYRLPVCRLEY